MPELPEVEHLRRTLLPLVVGARVAGVRLLRSDIVRAAGTRRAMANVQRCDLLDGCVIVDLARHGKSLAIMGKRRHQSIAPRAARFQSRETPAISRVLAVHLGMTGTMQVMADDQSTVAGNGSERDAHLHCSWVLQCDPVPRAVKTTPQPKTFALIFRDPRRFGGLYPFDSIEDLHQRSWARLGPDALTIDGAMLHERLKRTQQPIKAALLNQRVIAGVGNIYADEALFEAGIDPKTPASRLQPGQCEDLAMAIRGVMLAAIEAGGSTISDYRDGLGHAGGFAASHRVYGRGGEPCLRCAARLKTAIIGQRMTVFCPQCQRRRGTKSSTRGEDPRKREHRRPASLIERR